MYINDSANKQPKPGTKSTIQELDDRPPLFTLTQSLKTKSTETSSDEDYEPDDTVTPKISQEIPLVLVELIQLIILTINLSRIVCFVYLFEDLLFGNTLKLNTTPKKKKIMIIVSF